MKLSGCHKPGLQKHHFSPSPAKLFPSDSSSLTADLIDQLMPGLGQGECPWDLGVQNQEIPQLSPTPGQGTAGFSHDTDTQCPSHPRREGLNQPLNTTVAAPGASFSERGRAVTGKFLSSV